MKPLHMHLPLLVTVILSGTALWHGPIAQLPNYHDFADQTTAFGIPHFADVISNLGFALVAVWGWWQLAPAYRHAGLKDGWAGYRLFLIGLLLTAIGSSYYHLAPDNASLVWDRLPIALACGGLLAGVRGDVRRKSNDGFAAVLAILAIASVAWWHFTEQTGVGDLRPYLLLQALPIVLIPLWQWLYDIPRAERWAFAGALLLYVIAKFSELYDHEIAVILGVVTGHTLKHLLATAAAAVIVAFLIHKNPSFKRHTDNFGNGISTEQSTRKTGLVANILFVTLALTICSLALARDATCLDKAKTNPELEECGKLQIYPAEDRVDKEFKRIAEKHKDDAKFLELFDMTKKSWNDYRNILCRFEAIAAADRKPRSEMPAKVTRVFMNCVSRTLSEMQSILGEL